jgi:NAD(P)-dependent dehydrogenase (short-subunit alcohol dehydrogenase family)
MRLAGKTAIVTGGASGLGRATALLFAKEGAQVAIADISVDGGAVQAQITQSGGSALAVSCDVSDESQVRQAVEATLERFGKIDILINNAGVNALRDETIASLPLSEWDRAFSINALGPYLFCRHVIPSMKAQRQGSIVNVSSNGALYGSNGGHASRASKAALFSLTRTLAIELADDNIRVNCLCPGAMDTPLRQVAAKTRPVVSSTTVPLGRIADPREIAYFILFLASDEASYVTGAVHVADGGRTAV